MKTIAGVTLGGNGYGPFTYQDDGSTAVYLREDGWVEVHKRYWRGCYPPHMIVEIVLENVA